MKRGCRRPLLHGLTACRLHHQTTLWSLPVEIAKRVARNFHRKIMKAGMAGLRTSVETCYGRARRTFEKSAIQYCYLLDQLASSADAAMMRNLKMPQDVFWQSQSALARTMAVMLRIQARSRGKFSDYSVLGAPFVDLVERTRISISSLIEPT